MAHLPLIIAAAKAQSWVDVLRCFSECCKAVDGFYTPAPSEYIHGIQRMSTSWGLSLFYYSVVKRANAMPVNESVAAAALKQFRVLRNVAGMKRVFEEDIKTNSYAAVQSALLLASYTGMWEKAVELYHSNPSFSTKPSMKKSVIQTLCSCGYWVRALDLLHTGVEFNPSPYFINSIVKCLSIHRRYDAAIYLAAQSLAAGHSLDSGLFTSLLPAVRSAGRWEAALQTAGNLHMLLPEAAVPFRFTFFNCLVDCLYESDVYAPLSMEDIIRDVEGRLQPRQFKYRTASSSRHFRLMTVMEVHKRYASLLSCLTAIYSRLIRIPRWYKKSVSSIIDDSFSRDSAVFILDTNFLMQCVSKNLPLEHFFSQVAKRFPEVLQGERSTTVVVPFTAVQELHHLIWDPRTRVRHAVRVFMWSRLQAMLHMENVFCLSFSTEYPTVAFSILTQMAYSKCRAAFSTQFKTNPDARILNVCLALQHYIRCKEASTLHGVTTSDGIMLFSFLKMHVRRYHSTINGPTTSRLVLCTLDRNLSEAATKAGVLCFPSLWE